MASYLSFEFATELDPMMSRDRADLYEFGSGGGAPPVPINWVPVLAARINKDTPIQFLVDASAIMKRTLILAQFTQLGVYEVVHDGDGFSDAYPVNIGNSRTQIGLDYQFNIIRKNGWPASLRIVPVLIDLNGAVNEVTGAIYAWTLGD